VEILSAILEFLHANGLTGKQDASNRRIFANLIANTTKILMLIGGQTDDR
jgi:hypothetical protein